MNNSICIIGASGAIGKRMMPYLDKNLPGYEVEGTCFKNKMLKTLVKLNMLDYIALESYIIARKPNLIIWLSGTKDVKKCEIDEAYAFSMNCKPIENLLNILQLHSRDTKVIYISTDYVFDGKRGLYQTVDACNPLTNYGKSKLKSEQLLLNSDTNSLILRTSAVMIKGEGFLGWITSQLTEGVQVGLYANSFFSPTPIDFLNSEIVKIINQDEWMDDILHVSGPRISRYDFGLKLAAQLRVDPSLILSEKLEIVNTIFQTDISLVSSVKYDTNEMWLKFYKELTND